MSTTKHQSLLSYLGVDKVHIHSQYVEKGMTIPNKGKVTGNRFESTHSQLQVVSFSERATADYTRGKLVPIDLADWQPAVMLNVPEGAYVWHVRTLCKGEGPTMLVRYRMGAGRRLIGRATRYALHNKLESELWEEDFLMHVPEPEASDVLVEAAQEAREAQLQGATFKLVYYGSDLPTLPEQKGLPDGEYFIMYGRLFPDKYYVTGNEEGCTIASGFPIQAVGGRLSGKNLTAEQVLYLRTHQCGSLKGLCDEKLTPYDILPPDLRYNPHNPLPADALGLPLQQDSLSAEARVTKVVLDGETIFTASEETQQTPFVQPKKLSLLTRLKQRFSRTVNL